MADRLTAEKRSWNMSRIKGKDTKPEVKVRKYLFSKGFRFRKNDNRYPGKPDIVLPKYKTVIFVNGCFWHMHKNCKYFVWPKSNSEFWRQKLEKNVENDIAHYRQLREMEWNVITVWECEINTNDKFISAMEKIVKAIENNMR